ncbi:MAG: sigma factor [Bacteroidota bacterium]
MNHCVQPTFDDYLYVVNHAQVIVLYQPTLQSIALKMLGSLADAEDIVHDTFLKWMTIDTSRIQNTKAFLIRTVTNKCINFLKGHGQSRISGDLTEVEAEMGDDQGLRAVTHFDTENQLAEAWRILHRKLEPAEKAIYVLREAFNIDYDDLQHIVDKSAVNCRKLFSRAKCKVRDEMPKINIDLSVSIRLPASFKNASLFGDLSALVADLTKEMPRPGKK